MRFIEASEIIAAVDIVEYIGQYIELEQKGREHWGLSCFTDEKTPSFSVDPDKQCFCDFSSGYSGNLLSFVMLHDHTDVPGALRILKEYAGIRDDEPGADPGSKRMEASKVAKKYRSHLRPAPKMTAKPLPPDCMERWYEFDPEKLSAWAGEGISFDTMRSYHVRYDPLDDRIVYPVRDYEGNIISVCGRTCDPDWKAKGLRKYTYKQTIGTLDTVYGFWEHQDSIIDRKEIILFEGAKSCMKAEQWGYPNTGALLTSHLSRNQMRFLIKLASWHGVRAVFALDAEIDIRKDENIQGLTRYARVQWLKNRDDLLDPKDSPTDKGKETFIDLYQRREEIGSFIPSYRGNAAARR